MTLILVACIAYYGLAVFWYWLPLLALRFRSLPALPPDPSSEKQPPYLVAIAPCLHAAPAIPGWVAAMRQQDYPADRFRMVVLIDRETEDDPSAQLAQAAGAEVYERLRPEVRTKGAAVNELLEKVLQHQPWDAVLIFDIDGRIEPHYLTRVAAWLQQGAQVLQTAPQTHPINPDPWTRIGHSAQLLSQLVQQGRSALGWPAILSGACMVLSREALNVLGWRTSTAQRMSDDGELNFRCLLNGLFVTYARDLIVWNDLPDDARSVGLQRRRWFAAHVEVFPYLGPCLSKAFKDVRVLETMFTLLLLPGSSISFALAGLAMIGLGFWSLLDPRRVGWFIGAAVLWSLHAAFYATALRHVGGSLRSSEWRQLPVFLAARAWGIWQGLLLGLRRNPGRFAIPAAHRGEHWTLAQSATNSADKGPRDHLEQGG